MKGYYITFRSVTYAQRGERVLREASIPCTLQRATRMMEERGCGYSLALGQRDVTRAVSVLRSHRIPFRKVYAGEGGVLEEVPM